MGQTTSNPDDWWELELCEDSWLLQLCSCLRDIQNNGFVILFFLPNYHVFLTDNHKDNIRVRFGSDSNFKTSYQWNLIQHTFRFSST